ncbi:MAG: LysR family transcriptional regulator [Holophagaceae bacterium]|nr:LysR family transcriptional regulator [Holophagaceae bacterium]
MALRKLPRHLTWLESFAAAVETGTLEGAAQHLGVARSVVSEHLRALEDAVTGGESLIERGPGKRFKLTPRGERLYAASQAPLHALDLKRLQDSASLEPGLRLGLNPTLSSVLLEPLAAEMARRGIKLEASFSGAFDLVRQVQTRQLDLALGFTPLPPHRGVEPELLAHLPFVVLASPHSALAERFAARRRLKVKDLAGQAFVDWLRDDPYGGANSARFAGAGIRVAEVARVESFLQLYPALRAYKAVAIAPDLRRLAPFPKDILAWELAEEDPQPVDVVALAPSGGSSPEARACLAFLKRRLR